MSGFIINIVAKKFLETNSNVFNKQEASIVPLIFPLIGLSILVGLFMILGMITLIVSGVIISLGYTRKHPVLLILLQDSLLSAHANRELKNEDDFYLRTAGREMFLQRNKAVAMLKKQNINVLDVPPRELTGPLVNKYLELKARNRL